MKVEIGDKLVFTKNKVDVLHYENFVVGKQYTVRDISAFSYGIDDIYYEHSLAVIFENEKYGTYMHDIDKYFVKLDEYRSKKIDQII